MDIRALLPDSSALRLEEVSISENEARLVVSSMRPAGVCPACGRSASRVHSRYQRILQDLSWHGSSVAILWHTRKFFCDTPGCPQEIFTERLPTVAVPYGRQTVRLREMLECLGISLGGEAGSRLAKRLGLPISGDSLLRIVRGTDFAPLGPPRVIGIDDWALRRGQQYGSIIVDLERHRPLDLLPDRKWDTFRNWLLEHPGVEVISRDRADYYARGASAGAPQATQVVDRFHLLQNLREALQRAAEPFQDELQQATTDAALAEPKVVTTAPSPLPGASSPKLPEESPQYLENAARRRRMERYDRILELHQAGKSQCEIASLLGLNRKTVRRMLTASSFPERAAPVCHRSTDPYLEYMQRRWSEVGHNARILYAELVQLGYRGSYYSVRRTVAAWRSVTGSPGDASTPSNSRTCPARPTPQRPSPRRVSWLLFLRRDDLGEEEQRLVDSIRRHCPPLATAMDLAQEFRDLVKNRQPGKLADWITRASETAVPPDVRRFALGLLADQPLIETSLAVPWSNGQLEGQINRLKLLKREAYGRAKLDLLEARFVHALR